MIFPAWVNEPPGQPTQALASKRLTYIIRKLATEHTSEGTIHALATKCGVDRTSIYTFMDVGAFSARTASKIERALGREVIRHEDLIAPLEIAAEV